MDSINPFLHAPFLGGLTVFALLLLYLRSIVLWKARTKGLPRPPGPRGLPLVGNLFDLPTHKPWLGYIDLRRKYGDIVYLEFLGSPMMVVGSARVAIELLDKRSANTSDRTPSIVADLCNVSETIVSSTFQSVILNAVYGVHITDATDNRLSIAAAAIDSISDATPGYFAVELFPVLRHLPKWFPGASFHQGFARSRAANHRLKHELFDEVKAALARGEERPCVASDLLRRAKESGESGLDPEEEEVMKNVCAVAIEGSSDTTGNTFEAFFVAMALYPEVQKKAQAELDSVVGRDRLPDHGDKDELVYINAIVKEALRWHNVLPLGIPHRTINDDEMDGYFIPGGTSIITNVWGILHDPEVYDDPLEFRPERFIKDGKLDPTVPDPTAFMFGFGRRQGVLKMFTACIVYLTERCMRSTIRICPGRHLAIPSLFINIASVLHVFDISLPLDENGQPIQIKYEQGHGLISVPEDIRCTIKPRSAAAEALVRESLAGSAGGRM
ncbi:hypothetical protein BN946_scf184915.g50 [Trametes cinnabarina]|uniref:Cytochrome P450 n=1 Tax=Pycnoporus cinnabarinus TaxID=5643 RepID=A0A060SBT8_PYCCI|nr:hypothetical protein BN946_scf184915.g50 [Trametes cinnabarina]